jgi:hypothetical protein
MAVLLREPEGPRCSSILSDNSNLFLSAATLAEALVVASFSKTDLESAL